MRFKTRIKGLRPEVFERAAEMLDSGEVGLGCCYALMLAAVGTSWGEHTRLLDEVFHEDSNPRSIYWFGPVRYTASGWHERGWRAANRHRITSLLLLAAMIRFANQ